MASRPIVPHQQPKGGADALGKQKPVTGNGNNRRALGDIGNLVNVRGIEGKPQPQLCHRPVTRSFGAQLLANAQAAAAADKKSAAIVVDGVIGKGGVKVSKQKVTIKPKPETVIEISPDTQEETTSQKKPQEKSTRKKVETTLTKILTARSQAACGLTKANDIDGADSENQLAVVEYVEDMYKFYRLAETSSRIHDYMDSQTQINDRMRSILMDWLIEVHNKFELMPETLYLTQHIVDRYLSMEPNVLRRELQLVGIAGMLIASKYEEIWAPEINEFICVSDKVYNREQILRMEKKILNKLEWSITVPTPYVFLVRFFKAAASDKEMEHMCFFFAELALMQYSMIMYCPSMIAASSVYTARCTLKKSPLWSETLKHHTGFSEPQLLDCAKHLVMFHSMAAESKLKGVYKKYSTPEHDTVALLPPASNLLEELAVST
ncbi:G2/mitotic-specific cyclin S13-7-like isoform X2 [Tasmannia lanceolata]|uniref:G2/mitotic-specific cyclin S13-7-like isoform X2 n=1 Tax=Tasmannia lanceolata TaxID=3420 RepID=UPI004064B4A0